MSKLLDLKNTFTGKVLAVMLSVLLAVSMVDAVAFAASETDAPAEGAPVTASVETPAQADDSAAGQAGATAVSAVQEEPAAPGAVSASAEPAAPAAPAPAAPVQPEASAPAAPAAPGEPKAPAEENESAVAVSLNMKNAYIVIAGQPVSGQEASVMVPKGKDFTFVAVAEAGYEIDQVKVSDGVAFAQVQENTYTVAAADVKAGLSLKVTAKKAENDSIAKEEVSVLDSNSIVGAATVGSYKVTYSTSGSCNNAPAPTDPNGYNKGDTVVVLGNPGGLIGNGGENDKSDFVGWSPNNNWQNGKGTVYFPGDTFEIKGNTTLYPVFKSQMKEETLATVLFVPGSGGTLAGQTEYLFSSLFADRMTFGSTIAESGIPVPSPNEGFVFDGWKVVANNTGNGIPVGTTYEDAVSLFAAWQNTKITGDVTFEAQWKPVQPEKTYTVKYTDGVDNEEIFADQMTSDIKYGEATPAFNGMPVREDYYFTGWAPAVAPTVTGNMEYVAQWEQKHEVTVVANSAEVTYNGEEQSVSGVKVLGSDDMTFVFKGQTYTVSGLSAEAKGIDANVYTSMWTGAATVTDVAGADVTERFTVKTKDGSLTIKKREVTLTSASDTKEYDGTPLTNDAVDVSGDGFVGKDGATFIVTGSQTYVGDSKNTFTYELNSDANKANYNITTEEGTLTVIDRPDAAKYQVVVTARSDSFKYDGTEKSVSGFEALEFTVNGQKFTVEGLAAEAKGTDAGEYISSVAGTAVVKDAAGADVTKQFSVETVNGKLVVEKRSVTLTSATASKQYDGKPLMAKKVVVSGDGFVEGQGATWNDFASQTAVGSVDNTFGYTLNEGTKTENYTITKVCGTLTVTNRDAKYEITVEANSATHEYDGTEKSVSGFKTLEFEVEGEKYIVSGLTAQAKGTDAREHPVNVTGTAVVKDSRGNDVTKQFRVQTVNGELLITKRPAKVASTTASKEYDGTELTAKAVTTEGFVEGDGIVADVTGSQTLVGSSANSFTYVAAEGTNLDNYDVAKTEGALTVVPRAVKYEVTVEALSGGSMYNGSEQTVSGFKTLEFTMSNGQAYTVSGLTASAAKTDAGEYPVSVTGTPVVRDAADNDVTAQFDVKTVDGKLAIGERTVIMTSASDSKPYDGTPLTNATVEETGDGFVGAESAQYEVTGSVTLPGTVANTFTYELANGAKAGNYKIETHQGQLTVTNRDALYNVEVTVDSISKTYDGEDAVVNTFVGQTKNGIAVVVEGKTYYVQGLTANGVARDAGSYAANAEGTPRVVDENNNDVTAQFSVKVNPGSIEIVPREILLESAFAEKAFDGTPLTSDEIKVADGSFVKGEGAVYDVKGSQTYVGSSKNEFTYVLNGNTKQDNYVIKVAYGTLTVTPNEAAIVATVQGGTHEYDGTEHRATVSVAGIPEGFKVEAYSDAAVTNVGTVTAQVDGFAIFDMLGNDVTDQFKNINKASTDTVKVTPRPYSVTTASATKTYNGTPLAAGGQVMGLVLGETVDFKTTGTITEVGETPNTYELAWIGTAKESNYVLKEETIGTLKVTDADISGIVAESYKGVYDGVSHGITVTAPEGSHVVFGDAFDNAYTDVTEGAVKVPFTVSMPNHKDYHGEQTVTITPHEIKVTAHDATKVEGALDPIFTHEVTGAVAGETAALKGALEREPGEAVGSYAIEQGTIALADNEATGFKASNYVLAFVPATLTITAQPVVPPVDPDPDPDPTPNPDPEPTPDPDPEPTPDPDPVPTPDPEPAPNPEPVDPTDPAGPNPGTNPEPGQNPDPAPAPEPGTIRNTVPEPLQPVVEVMEAVAETVAPAQPDSPTEEVIDAQGNPLAGGGTNTHCWVHYYIMLGILFTVVYFAGALLRRKKFTSSLENFEESVLNANSETANATRENA